MKLTRYAASTDDNNDGTVLVLNTDYTVGGTQDARTFTLIGSQAVLTSSQRIVAERVQGYTQDLDLTTGGAFTASAVESRFDKHGEFLQELKARMDRTVPMQFADATASVGFPSPPTSATAILGRNTAGEFVHVTAADVSADVVLGSGWETILGLPAAGTLDNLAGIRFVATYAALTALTTASGLSDNSIYCTYGRATEEDGGFGFWRYDSGSSSTANSGTILAIDGGGAGRFFRLMDDHALIEWFGGKAGDTAHDNTTARNLWRTAAAAGTAPPWLVFGKGIYYHLSVPTTITGITNARISGTGPGSTILMQRYTTATQTNALIGFGADAAYGMVEDLELATADGYRGGSALYWVADSSNAPSSPRTRNVTITTFTSKATKTISSFTTASPGVITTSASHGFATDEVVVLDGLVGGTFYTLGPRALLAVVTGASTLTLKDRDSGVAVDTTALGTWSAGTIRSGECFDWGIYIDGTLKTTGSIGVRVANFTEMEIFGCARGAIKYHGVSTARFSGGIYSSGFNGFVHISGTAGVPSDSITFDVSDMGGINLDRATSIRIHGDVAGHVIDTSNTVSLYIVGEISGVYTALGATSSDAEFIRFANGMVWQRIALTGMSGAPVTINWPAAFDVAPTTVWVTDQVTTFATITATGANYTNASSATGTAYAIGFI